MSDKKVIMLKDVKERALAVGTGAMNKYPEEIRNLARHAWWDHCEVLRTPSIPTFRNFWDDEATYSLIA